MKLLIVIFAFLSLTGCALSIDGERYANAQPDFNLQQFFEGEVKAWGIVQDRSGNLVQRFEVDIIGSVEGDTLTLDEKFYYSLGDGPAERVWTITEKASGSYSGFATDIPGPAFGRDYGNAVLWSYEMDLPVGDTSYVVKFEDWIWAFDEKTILNRSYIKKFGIVMAEVTIFMQKAA